mmetsp:Transcript_9154/g.18023  ORF Transcript_9154/g.18023 Transcript_9154/m.18023 type:complete len:239 (-) Transcript_9154:394-1110(-)
MYHVFAATIAGVGMIVSLYALLGERFKWASFTRFSVATKVPVVILCVSGPIVMVTFILYAFLAFLLVTERATSTCFYISASWTVIFTDMSLILYRDWRDLCRRNVDLSLHIVNSVILIYTFANMPYTPTSFVLISLGCWGSLVMSRVFKRYMEKHRPRLPSREEFQERGGRLMGQSSATTQWSETEEHDHYHHNQQPMWSQDAPISPPSIQPPPLSPTGGYQHHAPPLSPTSPTSVSD